MLVKTLSLLLGTALSRSEPPPDTGTFFYADFRAGGKQGVHFVDLQLSKGDDKRKMNLFVTTKNSEIGIITDKCPNPGRCDVPAPFDYADVIPIEKNYKRLPQETFIFDKHNL